MPNFPLSSNIIFPTPGGAGEEPRKLKNWKFKFLRKKSIPTGAMNMIQKYGIQKHGNIYFTLHRNIYACKSIKIRRWRESWFSIFQMVTTGDDKYRPPLNSLP